MRALRPRTQIAMARVFGTVPVPALALSIVVLFATHPDAASVRAIAVTSASAFISLSPEGKNMTLNF
jgi:hypothetical protein